MAVPTDVDLVAPKLARAELDVVAPRPLVWHVHTYVNAWSTWHPDITYAVAEQPLAPGVQFRWHTRGRAVVSTVDSVDDAVRIQWCCVVADAAVIHTWTFTDTPTGVRVATTACQQGPSDPAGSERELERSLVSWLRSLKAVVEAR